MDHCLSFSADGNEAFWASTRPGGFGGEDIYVTTRDHTGAWGPLVNLGPLVNSDKDDRCPSLTPDSRVFLFDSERPGGYGSKDIWWVYYDQIKHIR